MFGPTFGDELIAAGLGSLPFGWRPDGTLVGVDNLTDNQQATLKAVISAHDPNKKLPVSFTPLAILKTLRAIDEAAARAWLANQDELDKAEFFAADKILETEPLLVSALSTMSVSVDQLKDANPEPVDMISAILSAPQVPTDINVNPDEQTP